jgi:hypothetical protein
VQYRVKGNIQEFQNQFFPGRKHYSNEIIYLVFKNTSPSEKSKLKI